MFVYDREPFQYLAVNDAAIAKYGYSRAEFLAMKMKDRTVNGTSASWRCRLVGS